MQLYHGSPYENMDFINFKGIAFFTPDKAVARAYALNQRVDGKEFNFTKGPTIYTVNVTGRFLDTRTEVGQSLYRELKQRYDDDPDDPWPSLKARNGNGLFGFGMADRLRHYYKGNIDGVWVDEGSQGISLAIYEPRNHAHIIKAEKMNTAKLVEAYIIESKRHVHTTPNIGQIIFMTDAKVSELRDAVKSAKSPLRALATNDAIYSWEAYKATHDEMTKFLQSKEIIERNASAISLVITAYGKGIEIGVYPKDVDTAVRNKNIVRLLKSHPENEIMEM